MGKTAAELMAELASDKGFQSKKKAKDEHFSELEKIYASDEKGLVEELNRLGYSVRSVWDLVNSKKEYVSALPVLTRHLSERHHPKILAGIARSLAVPEFSGNHELWNVLVHLYGATRPDSDIGVPEERGVQQAVAVALECLASESRIDDLERLVIANPSGDGVSWLQAKVREFTTRNRDTGR